MLTVSDHINLSLEEAEEHLSSFTYPIFAEAKNNKPELIASSVIISHNGRFFLVTASHVLDCIRKLDSAFHLGINQKFVVLDKNFIRSRPLNPNNKDNFDIAVYELSEQFISENQLSFISRQKMLVNRSFEHIHLTCIHGYPCSKNKQVKALKGSNKFSLFAYTYSGQNIEFNDTWLSHEKDPEFHSSIKYSAGKTKSGALETPPSPRGVSGGGCWVMPSSFKPTQVYLKGIFIEYYEKEKATYSTNINKVLAFIDENA